jgi:ATP-dependent Lhr-like helicase
MKVTMTSEASGSETPTAFSRLHPAIQRWIWDEHWKELRRTQVEAVGPILAGDVDVIVSATTASGKTEAAFLPMLSAIASQPATVPGVEILYMAPLKALINDQFERLSEISARVEVPVHRWHGDVSGSRKHEVLRRPGGLLLITPESLEAFFVLRGEQVPLTFGALRYVVVDELHSFIATERGTQLQSLLNRLELAVRRRIPRIALSATLGDMKSAAEFLRPGAGERVHSIVADDGDQALKLQLRGYLESAPRLTPAEAIAAEKAGEPVTGADTTGGDQLAIAADVFGTLRGSDNLVFANSRRLVEVYTDLLSTLAERNRVPNEFFAHHGNLSKEFREDVESRLKDKTHPANAVCTSTLEMGIDIGQVRSIAQIGAPPTVAAMRQRLGRSGRRGDPAVLRIYVSEAEVKSSTPPPDSLRAELVQSVAMVSLLLERWYEPPDPGDLHLSTLIQQLLSIIAQHGGVSAADAYEALCGVGPFDGVSKARFATLLRHLGGGDVITQSVDGTLLLGGVGERVVNHYSFYAAFATPEEWRLVNEGRSLGTLPIDFPLLPGLFLIFGGRRWRVVAVDGEHKVVDLVSSAGGHPPRFTGTGARVHNRVRREMLRLYQSAIMPTYLDSNAAELLTEGRQNFVRYRLDENQLLQFGDDTYIFIWEGDRILDTVVALLGAAELSATRDGLALSVAKISPVEVAAHLMTLLAGPAPDPVEVASRVCNKLVEKFDVWLPDELLVAEYAARSLDVEGAWRALQGVVESTVASR